MAVDALIDALEADAEASLALVVEIPACVVAVLADAEASLAFVVAIPAWVVAVLADVEAWLALVVAVDAEASADVTAVDRLSTSLAIKSSMSLITLDAVDTSPPSVVTTDVSDP